LITNGLDWARMLPELPIDAHVGRIVETVRANRAAVIAAPPGAGKTTRVPPALAADGATILLQPRRVAARALAARIASERGWRLGREVGWQVRHERRFTPETRLLVATEGILTARLQADPFLSGFLTVVLDEFHERSLHADLALALVRQAMHARDDLRVVVMSATLDAGPVAEFLGGCPIIDVPGRPYPVEIRHAPERSPMEAILDALEKRPGHVLCFLPGAPEIRRLADDLRRALPQATEARILPLHGSLEAAAQDAALAPSERPKVILATNLAETSLTVDGVGCVIDCGRQKVMRRDPASGLDRLEVERIPRDSAEQRAGRAGRTGPGTALRLWDQREELRPHREPEILRVDLAAPLLEVLAWGGNPRTFAWFEPPPPDVALAAIELLTQLGAVADERITDLGRALRRLPLHPRLGRLLLAAGGTTRAAAACAALAEHWRPRGPAATTRSDLSSIADRIATAPRRVTRAASELEQVARRLADLPSSATPAKARDEEERFLAAVLSGYPDRVARRREPGSDRLLLASGHGATLTADSGVRDEFLVAVDVIAGQRGPGSEARVRVASAVEPGWIAPTGSETIHELDADSGKVRATARTYHGSLILCERSVSVEPAAAAELLANALLERGLDARSRALLARARFAGIQIDLRELAVQACLGQTTLPEFDLRAWLPHDTLRAIERLAPERLDVPSGRQVPLEYRDDGTVFAAVKLQELFGLAETPAVGAERTPVTFSLLAPNGRPVQTTRDLRSFWDTTYAEVRKQLRGRYPKHPWPEDPWKAAPTARAKPRRRPPE
jgi:ATP-dependent helicase HrpB